MGPVGTHTHLQSTLKALLLPSSPQIIQQVKVVGQEKKQHPQILQAMKLVSLLAKVKITLRKTYLKN